MRKYWIMFVLSLKQSLAFVVVQGFFFFLRWHNILIITWRIVCFKVFCCNWIKSKIGVMVGCHSGEQKNGMTSYSSFLLYDKINVFVYWKTFFSLSGKNLILRFSSLIFPNLYFKYFESLSHKTELQVVLFSMLKNF